PTIPAEKCKMPADQLWQGYRTTRRVVSPSATAPKPASRGLPRLVWTSGTALGVNGYSCKPRGYMQSRRNRSTAQLTDTQHAALTGTVSVPSWEGMMSLQAGCPRIWHMRPRLRLPATRYPQAERVSAASSASPSGGPDRTGPD